MTSERLNNLCALSILAAIPLAATFIYFLDTHPLPTFIIFFFVTAIPAAAILLTGRLVSHRVHTALERLLDTLPDHPPNDSLTPTKPS